MKKVILITNYFHFKQEKESNRYRELAEKLSCQPDISLEVITSRFYQRTKKRRDNVEELCKDLNYKVTFIDEPGYKKNISFQRVHTSKIFGKRVLSYLKTIKKPDVIYQVVPTLDVAFLVSGYANSYGIPLIIDIQDLWPEAFKMALNIPVISDLLFFPFMRKANIIYSRADEICAVSGTYVKRALSVSRKCSEGHAVYIGINLQKFDEFAQNAVKENCNQLKLAYCGSMDTSYDLKTVVDALSIMNNPPVLVAMGDGSLKKEFEDYAIQKNVKAIFPGYLPYPEMCKKLCECDITINPIIGTSVASIINKHGDYAASGLPVINTQESDEYRQLVDSYYMGFNCKNGDAKDIAEKLSILCADKKLREIMGHNSRRCAEERFDRFVTYQELIETIRTACCRKTGQ